MIHIIILIIIDTRVKTVKQKMRRTRLKCLGEEEAKLEKVLKTGVQAEICLGMAFLSIIDNRKTYH